MRHYPGPGGFGGGSMMFGIFGFICTLVVLALLALLVIFLVKRSKGQMGTGGPRMHGHLHQPSMPPALQVLDERLARGEIEVEDYTTRKAALLGTAGPATNEWTPQQPEAPKPQDEDPSI